MKQKNESILDMLIAFFPAVPGILWIFCDPIVIEVIFATEIGKVYTLIGLLSFPVCYPLYCALFCKRGMGNRPIYPALLYFTLDVAPTISYTSFMAKALQKLTGWEGTAATWLLWFFCLGPLFLLMWLTSAVIYRWMKKRA